MHAVIHNPLSAPYFKNLIKSAFVHAKILKETIGEINKPKDVCLKFYDIYCSVIGCEKRTLLACAGCPKADMINSNVITSPYVSDVQVGNSGHTFRCIRSS